MTSWRYGEHDDDTSTYLIKDGTRKKTFPAYFLHDDGHECGRPVEIEVVGERGLIDPVPLAGVRLIFGNKSPALLRLPDDAV